MVNHKGTIEIKTERLLLQKIAENDAEDLFELMGDPEVCKYEQWRQHPSSGFSRGYIKEVYKYENDMVYQWGIEYEGRLVGYVVVVNVDNHNMKATIGYALHRKLWSKGITTEAVRAVVRFMLSEVGLNRLEACHAVDNIASERVLQKAGFTREGTAREHQVTNAGLFDSHLYGITRNEFLMALNKDEAT